MTTSSGAITTPAGTPAAAPVHRTAVLVMVLVTYFMIILDNSVIFTGLPSIQRTMSLSTTGLSWVQDAYTLTFGGLLLLGARAGDILGRRPVFIAGLVLFTLASALVGASPTGWWMIGARALQGVGSAILAPSSLSLITATFPEGRARSRAVALYAAVAGIGASLGLVIGGVLADLISWRAGFYLNLPIGVVMLVLAVRFLPRLRRVPGRFDLVGAVASTLGVGAIIFGIVGTAEEGWASPRTIVSLTVGVVLLVVLVLNEARVAQPIMPLRLFASRQRTGAYVIRFLYLGAMMGFFYFTTQFLQNVYGFSPLTAGLGFLPMSAVNFGVAMAAPRLSRIASGKTLLALGVLATLAGMVWLSRVEPGSSYLTAVALPMILIGAGQGFAFAPLTSFGIAGATNADAGAASGLVNTFHQLGSSIGLAVLVAAGAGAVSAGTQTAQATAERVSVALAGSSALLVLASVVLVVVVLPAGRVRAAAAARAAA
jgi:EmrB/QacA subfamily drug resistance transporter